jgi:imidazolonepropionase-like amidohydrolase
MTLGRLIRTSKLGELIRSRVQLLAVAAVFSALGAVNAGHTAVPMPPRVMVVAARVLDVRSGRYLQDAAVYVEGERIMSVGPSQTVVTHAPEGTTIIALHNATVLAGLIDCHTHLMARAPDGESGYQLSLLTKSQAYRALEGAANARATLHAGFTTVRDVESEGSGYADVALRDAINDGLVEGPRMQVATRGIAAVGQYQPLGVSPDLVGFPTGAQMISGAEEARHAVREQIGHGADLIKVYADWHHPTLTVAEMQVVVEEAHKQGLKVAAHATTPEGIRNAVMAGVDSIEHGHEADRAALKLMKKSGTYLVPTLSVIDASMAEHFNGSAYSPRALAFLETLKKTMTMAKEMGVKIADGSDPSDATRHGRNALELEAMTNRGLTPIDAIRAATINAADLLGWSDKVGSLEVGMFADLIAVDGDPTVDIKTLQKVDFVMKGGKVIKNDRGDSGAQTSH